MNAYIRLSKEYETQLINVVDIPGGAIVEKNDEGFLEIQNEDGLPIALFKPETWAYVGILSPNDNKVTFNMGQDITHVLPKIGI